MKVKAIDEDLYLDERKVKIKELVDNNTLDKKITKKIKELTLPSVAVNTSTTKQIGSYTVEEDGIYLISGNIPINYYGQDGRSLHIQLKNNGEEFYSTTAVYNIYAWTVSQTISHICELKKGDIITIHYGSSAAKSWSCGEGKIQLVKL